MIEKLVKLQQDYKEVYGVICDVGSESVQIDKMLDFMELAEECKAEIVESYRVDSEYPHKATFFYKNIKFFTIY